LEALLGSKLCGTDNCRRTRRNLAWLLGWCSPEWKFILYRQVKAAQQPLEPQHDVEPAIIAGIVVGMGSSGGDGGKWGTRGCEVVETKWARANYYRFRRLSTNKRKEDTVETFGTTIEVPTRAPATARLDLPGELFGWITMGELRVLQSLLSKIMTGVMRGRKVLLKKHFGLDSW
jgi:hypothetical protein